VLIVEEGQPILVGITASPDGSQVAKQPRPRLNPVDRFFWMTLRCVWPRWTDVLTIVKPTPLLAGTARDFDSSGW
jgi:hypothetical protein